MCDVAMEQQQKESLCLLIPLTTSSFLTCPIFQCTSVSFFSHSVTPWMTYRCSVCQHPALLSFPSSYVAIPAPVPPDLLAKNDTPLNLLCATKNFSSSPANCLSTCRLALSCPTSVWSSLSSHEHKTFETDSFQKVSVCFCSMYELILLFSPDLSSYLYNLYFTLSLS